MHHPPVRRGRSSGTTAPPLSSPWVLTVMCSFPGYLVSTTNEMKARWMAMVRLQRPEYFDFTQEASSTFSASAYALSNTGRSSAVIGQIRDVRIPDPLLCVRFVHPWNILVPHPLPSACVCYTCACRPDWGGRNTHRTMSSTCVRCKQSCP